MRIASTSHSFPVSNNQTGVGYDAVAPLLAKAEQLVANDHERAYHTLSAELVAGIVRGSKHWRLQPVRQLAAHVTRILSTAFAHTPTDATAEWATAVRFMLSDRDPRRYAAALFPRAFLVFISSCTFGSIVSESPRLFLVRSC